MRPSKLILAVLALLIISSYTIALACDHSTEQAPETVQAVAVVSDAAPGSVDVTVTCELLEKALNNAVLMEAGRCPTTRPTAVNSIRAGVNLTRALSRAAAHLAVAMARTAYHTVTALT